jgi:hypothetical protein
MTVAISDHGGDDGSRNGEGRVRRGRAQHDGAAGNRESLVIVQRAGSPHRAETLSQQVECDESDHQHGGAGNDLLSGGFTVTVDHPAQQQEQPNRLERRNEKQRHPGHPAASELLAIDGSHGGPGPRTAG